MDRRDFLKTALGAAAGLALAKSLPTGTMTFAGEAGTTGGSGTIPTVFMTRDISPRGLMAIYRRLGREMKGNVAVKISTGEPGGHNYLAPSLIKDLVQSVNGTLVEANTGYDGRRASTADHMQAAKDHGFLDIAQVDIMDAEGEVELPITGGTHLKTVRVGSHYPHYDSMIVLSHFKGHGMAGFGGCLKNMAIGIASRSGKCLVHTAGRSAISPFDGPDTQDQFTESMAEAVKGMVTAMGPENIVHINVMNKLSIDCDCNSNPAAPELDDIGIIASLDPVAVDKAGIDLVYAADAQKGAALRHRIEEKRGTHILTHAEKIGVGSQRYTLVSIDA